MNTDPTPAEEHDVPDTRKPWITPTIEIMRAGDAEAGASPSQPEGAFGFGS